MMLIDAHAHIYPDKIADRASDAIGKFYDVEIRHNGKLSSLLEAEEKAGIGHSVVCSVATAPEQAQSINAFIAAAVAAYPGRLTGLGALHPQTETLTADIDDILANGLRGVKMHPDFQEFNIDCPEAMRVYEQLEGRLPVLLHCGDHRSDRSHPSRLAKVLRVFPKLTVQAAHFGGWSVWDDAAAHLGGTGVYVDSSSSLYALSPARAEELIRCFTPERVLFGVDYPMWDPGEELARFGRLNLTPGERDMILGGNAQRLYGIA